MIDEAVLAWGMHSLCVAFNREPSEDLRDLYREALANLTTGAFRVAVREVIQRERFFPPPAVLVGYAPTSTVLALPAPRRTEESKEAARLEARRGLELVKSTYAAVQAEILPSPVKRIPEPMIVVELTDERAAELRRQAEAIQS